MDQGVSLVAIQEFKTSNIAHFRPTYRMFCGAISGGTANLAAIRRDVVEFGEVKLEKEAKEWRIVAHEVKLRIPLHGAERFTFVSLHVRSQNSHNIWVQQDAMTMLDGFPQPVVLVGDINHMASRARNVEFVAKALRQTGGSVQGLPPRERESEVEQDEPCVVALYRSASSSPDGFGMASCYGVTPPDLVGGGEGDLHHPVHAILTVRKEALETIAERINKVRTAAKQQRLCGRTAQIQRQREGKR